jgi:hypothetical protein
VLKVPNVTGQQQFLSVSLGFHPKHLKQKAEEQEMFFVENEALTVQKRFDFISIP